jgi:hypothetical protein
MKHENGIVLVKETAQNNSVFIAMSAMFGDDVVEAFLMNTRIDFIMSRIV